MGFAVTVQAAFNTFILALITGLAGVIVVSTMKLIRRLKQMDADVRTMRRRQHHLMRWAQKIGRKTGLPFPLDDMDIDDTDRPED